MDPSSRSHPQVGVPHGVPSAGGRHGLPTTVVRGALPGIRQPRPTPAWSPANRASERAHVLDVLASPRFRRPVTGRGRR